MRPASASSFSSILSSSRRKLASSSGSRSSSSSATKRDICVPFWSAGRCTSRLKVPTLGMMPAGVFRVTGYRTPLTPTRWMGIWRVSRLDWTSGITKAGLMSFIYGFLQGRTCDGTGPYGRGIFAVHPCRATSVKPRDPARARRPAAANTKKGSLREFGRTRGARAESPSGQQVIRPRARRP
ncbi:hypothetical protein D3C72_1699930 [compost metagenome]